MGRIDVKPGDEVRVFSIYADLLPDAGYPGTVTQVRRVLFTVEVPGHPGMSGTYRLDSGRQNHPDPTSYVETVEVAEARARKMRAEQRLRDGGLMIRSAHNPFTIDQLEALAALVDSFETENPA